MACVIGSRIRRSVWLAGAVALAVVAVFLVLVDGDANAATPPAPIAPAAVHEAGTLAAQVTVSKTLALPSERTVLFVGETVNFLVEIGNFGETAVDVLPLVDTFDDTCLTFDPLETAPVGAVVNNTVRWDDLTNTFDGNLEPGHVMVVIVGFTVSGPTGSGLNTVQVNGALGVDGQPAVVDASAGQVRFTCVQPPALSVTSTPNRPTVRPGETVTYAYDVRNTGGTPLADIAVVDDKCAPVVGPVGDDGNGLLDVGESWAYSCSAALTATTTNTVVAQGWPADSTGSLLGDVDPVRAQATSKVTVTNAALVLQATAEPAYVLAGEVVTFSYRLTNQGAESLRRVTLVDDVCQATPRPPVDGDVNANSLLDPAEIWLYRCAAPILVDTVAHVQATAEDGSGNQLQASDAASVDVVRPRVRLLASVQPAIALANQTARYSYTVTNEGDVGLVDVQLSDNRCAPIVGPGGDNGNGLLDVNETWRYECSMVVTQDVTSSVLVTAQPSDDTGRPLAGLGLVADRAQLSVDVVHPVIALEKTANPSVIYRGDAVTYTFRVGNLGDTPLAEVTLTDAACTTLSGPGGDANGNSLLDPGETWVYTCSLALTQDADLAASVSGWPSRPDGSRLPGIAQVQASAAAAVDVINPALAVLAAANVAEAWPGDTIRYVYQVTNSGDDPLRGLSVSDDRCEPVTQETADADGVLEPRQMWVFSCEYTVSYLDRSTLVNTATARGLDSAGNPVTATDRESVTIRPGAVIGGVVWNDANGDGVRQAGEGGLAGVAVDVMAANGMSLSAITNASGRYAVDNLPAGLYSVAVDLTTVPPNLALSTADLPLKVIATNGQIQEDCNFGFVRAAKLGGLAFFDALVANGVRDPGETSGVAGLTVVLIDTGRGRTYTAQTDAIGEYIFAGLPPGVYLLSAEASADLAPTTMLPQRLSLAVGASALSYDLGWLASPPLRVVRFSSSAQPQGLVLRWEVALNGERDPGFHVWRSQQGADWRRLTAAPVVLSGVSEGLAVYEYVDASARRGEAYLFRLQMTAGASFGPWPAQVAGGRVYLPTVQASR